MTKKYALISVSDKTGVVSFAQGLQAMGYQIISTGGTKRELEKAGVVTEGIEDITHFPEMLDGRVKTLHPMIHGALLGKRHNPEHQATMIAYEMPQIDLVCVNLYPFKETLKKEGVEEDELIEQIDIGGPSMLRSASKNFSSVTVVVHETDYSRVLDELQTSGNTTLTTRRVLAAKAFQHTASYDALIAEYLTKQANLPLPETLTVTYDLAQTLRYGENNHQRAWFYRHALQTERGIPNATQHHGKELSYNNIKDADAALSLLNEYTQPTAVVVKHMNPCGVGFGETVELAFQRAYDSDPVSIFGGVVALNREVTLEVAEKLHRIFLEIVIAPSFSKEASAILSQKKNIRLLTLPMTGNQQTVPLELQTVTGGLLVQEKDVFPHVTKSWVVVTEREPSEREIEGLTAMWSVVKHVKSNAIVVGNSHQTLGIGAGQMNRVGSVKLAVEQADEQGEGAVLASDAFFPMADSVALAAQHGITAIIQPGGSIKDQASIDEANRHGLAMIFTGRRHFKH